MTLQAETKTLYVAARGDQILSDGYPTPDIAKRQVQHLSEQMTVLGLQPDLNVGEVQVKITIGRVKRYRDKDAYTGQEQATTDEDTGENTDPEVA